MRKVNPQEFPPIEELTVSVQYEGYFPSGFNVSTEKPNDAVVGITYSGSLSRYDGSAAELELAATGYWSMATPRLSMPRSSSQTAKAM